MVTRTIDGERASAGTVTSQEVCVGQTVLVGCPSKRARTSPFGLNRFVPWTTATRLALPCEGVIDESRGAPGPLLDPPVGMVVVEEVATAMVVVVGTATGTVVVDDAGLDGELVEVGWLGGEVGREE